MVTTVHQPITVKRFTSAAPPIISRFSIDYSVKVNIGIPLDITENMFVPTAGKTRGCVFWH